MLIWLFLSGSYIIIIAVDSSATMDNIGHHEEKISQTMKEKILDLKSRGVYDRWWSLYCGFCESINFARERYSSFLDFVGYLAENYKYSSIWQACSCINKYLKIRCETTDFLQEESFKCFMKRPGKSYVPKKSSVFTLDDNVKYNACEIVLLLR